MNSPTLELFHMPGCPYCRRVLNHMETNGITIPLRDITADRAAYDTLLKVGKLDQVPCLFIDGIPLYESNDIIAWLTSNLPGATSDAG